MSKGLEALQKLELDDCYTIEEFNECYSTIKKELKDFEWLKSKVSIDWFDKLSSDDKIKFMEIMGWKL